MSRPETGRSCAGGTGTHGSGPMNRRTNDWLRKRSSRKPSSSSQRRGDQRLDEPATPGPATGSALRGLICCGICGSRMQGAFRESKRKDGTGRIFYRCVIQRSRALPGDFDHPPSVYVRQEPIITQLNDWIGTLAAPASLAGGQGNDGATAATAADLRRRIREVEAKLANLVASIEAGIDPAMIAPQMASRTAERNELQSRLRQLLTA